MFSSTDLNFWIKNNYNVLFVGKHGVGKTSIIKDAFEKNNLNWLYFSASTMDPWVDFIGVPKEKQDENNVFYLDLIRPKAFAYDEVEAIFFDEFNRSAPKVRNAVMELIQFKSINGKKFDKLKIIWAAINPSEEEDSDSLKYDVEELDPAQIDRFQIKVNVPYQPVLSYFKSKYPEYGTKACNWWNKLSNNEKALVSPRRLDYMLDIYQKGGNLAHVIDKVVNTKELVNILINGTLEERMNKLLAEQNPDIIRSKLMDADLVELLFNNLLSNKNDRLDLCDYINTDLLVNLISKNLKTMPRNKALIKKLTNQLTEIHNSAGTKPVQKKEIKKLLSDASIPVVSNTIHKNISASLSDIDFLCISHKGFIMSGVGQTGFRRQFCTNFKINTDLSVLVNAPTVTERFLPSLHYLECATRFIGTELDTIMDQFVKSFIKKFSYKQEIYDYILQLKSYYDAYAIHRSLSPTRIERVNKKLDKYLDKIQMSVISTNGLTQTDYDDDYDDGDDDYDGDDDNDYGDTEDLVENMYHQ